MEIILDTNFLMLPNQFGVDIFEYLKHYDIATLSCCINELKKLGKGKGKDATSAKIALKLIEENNVKIIKSSGQADKVILDYALRETCMVATNDKALIEALKNNGIKVIRLKQKKYLTEE